MTTKNNANYQQIRGIARLVVIEAKHVVFLSLFLYPLLKTNPKYVGVMSMMHE
jgi:hypothetical protein